MVHGSILARLKPNSAYAPAVRGFTMRLVVFPIGVVASLASAAIMLDWGRGAYALFALVVSVPALLPVADLGLGAAVTTAAAQRTVSIGHSRAFVRTTAKAVRLLLVSAAVFAAVPWILLELGVLESMLGSVVESGHDARGAAWSLTFFALSIPFTIGQRVLVGVDRTPTWTLLQVLQPLTSLVTVISFSALGMPWLFATGPTVGLLALGILATIVAVHDTELTWRALLSWRRSIDDTLVDVGSTARPMLVVMLANPIALHADRLIISHSDASGALADYALVAQLHSPLLGLLSTSGMALWPIFAARREHRSTTVLSPVVGVFASMGFLLGAAVVVVGQRVAMWLSSGQVEPSYLVLVAFLVSLVVQAAHWPIGMYLTDPAGLRFQARQISLMVGMNLALSVVLVSPLGVAGPVYATAVSMVVCQLLPGIARVRREGAWRAGGQGS